MPLTPEPGSHSSVRRPPAGGSANGSAGGASPQDESAPTVITSTRPKAGRDPHHAESLVGRKLGHYELIQSVGVGGMAAVIKAMDERLGRVVALKILPPDMAVEPDNVDRFKQEARAAARLDHENIARVYYCGEDQGLNFIAFEFVEGENLRSLMEKRGGHLPVAEAVHYLIQVTTGLAHAAAKGVVHRDIKPSNIVITPDGKAKIVDMGLARNLDARASNGQLTQSGVTLGTFDYISPEQAIEPRSADVRSDIYSLGCTFYHVLTGRTPVPEGTAAKKLHCHQHVAPLDPREINPAIPDELAAVLGKMMAKDPAQRYQHPDHLLQHLLQVARDLDLNSELLRQSSLTISPYADRPLPAAPGLSTWWVGVAVTGLLLGLFALTGGFGQSQQPLDSAPFWQTNSKDGVPSGKKALSIAPGNVAEPPVFVAGPREARSSSDLVSLLRQGARHIKLRSGVVYDLTRRRDAEGMEAGFDASDILIECDRLNDKPTVRLLATPAEDGRPSRNGSLVLRANNAGSATRARFRGIRFEIATDEGTPEAAGISLLNFDLVEVEDCSFLPTAPKGKPEDGASVVSLRQLIGHDGMAKANFTRCWFAPGSVAIQLGGSQPQALSATDCAFGPQFADVRVESPMTEDDSRKPFEVRFESCSFLMSEGAVVEVGDLVPCQVRAGMCLFSNPELPDRETPAAFLIRQVGVISPQTRFEGLRLPDGPAGATANGYQHVLAYANGDLAYSFDDCKQEQVPVEDAGARQLTKNPWGEDQPIRRLRESPRQVRQIFALDLKQEALRLEPDRNRHILGVKNLSGIRVYDLFPLENPVAESAALPNVKVWHPEFPGRDDKLPANVYRSLEKALPDLAKGDVLLIRHNGPLEIDPIEFKRADTDLTIRPDVGCRPVLIPREPTLKKDQALFKLFGGQLTLQDLHFRLKPDRAPAVVTLPGGGQCVLRNCAVTLETGDDLCVVSLADPRGEMMMMGSTPEKWPAPKVTFENTFVRGRGKGLHVHGSRPFDLKLVGCLAVLDGSLVGVEPTAGDVTEAGAARIVLENVTAYLTKPLLAERRMEGKSGGLVPVQVQAANCLFAAAGEQAAIAALDRVDTMEQADGLFQWRDPRGNVYGFRPDQPLLLVQPENADTAMTLERVVRDRWAAKWRETDAVFGEVNFAVVPATRRFDGVKPGDFEVRSLDPPARPEALKAGAPIEALRKVAVEE